MATILVDYENVANTNGLRGSDALRDTDTLIIFIVHVVARFERNI